ncbi:CLK4-associating serine/arginine rich protein-like isoform X2 [Lycorma delicatula]|uniref:CLK4-associating serine/arginine rich protein-like isoform X2 n=1 Tax=Lycorma delicatula TaxID=130591 RepID=UPI003F514AD7
MMWHEARKQERKIRGMLVDYKKRAERRKDYYEKIKADPTQFLQLHGRPCKIHLDPAIAIAGDSPVNMMPWQGNQDILIDRFDVRAHLDFIPEVKQTDEQVEALSVEERHINYERYRILVQNDFLGVGEEKFLRQLHLEEQYGPILRPADVPDTKSKKNSSAGAAIGYNYDEGATTSTNEVAQIPNAVDASHLPASIVNPDAVADDAADNANDDAEEDEEEDDDDSDIDFDLCVDVSKVDTKQAHEMNTCAHMYGMQSNDFFSFLTRDVEEAENLRIAREQEEEKAMYSGRKARRERRAYRDKKLMGRKFSPPSYASRKSPTYFAYRESKSKSLSKSRSRSQSPANAGQVTYITSFGGDEPPVPEVPKNSGNSVAGHSRSSSVRYRSRSQKSSEISRGRSRGGRSPLFRRSKSRSRGSHTRRRSRSWSRSRRRSRTRPDESSNRGIGGGGGVGGMRGIYRRRTRSRSPSRRRSISRNRRSYSRGCSRSRSPRRGRSPDPSHIRKPSFNKNPSKRSSYIRKHRDSRTASRSPSVSNRKKQNEFRVGSQSPAKKKPPMLNENKSPSPVLIRSVEIPAPPVITRYYGRNQQESSSELSYSSEDESTSVASSNAINNSVNSSSQQQLNKLVPDKNLRTGFGNSGGGRNKVTFNIWYEIDTSRTA